jgi:4-amino-4-deoxy-L-arabinose transferase-like glycosyltransferase
MLVVLPILCFFCLLAAFARRPGTDDWRPAFLRAAVTWGACVAVITEVLSPFHLLTAPALAAAWATVALAAIAATLHGRGLSLTWRHGRFDLACVAAVAAIAVVTGFLACLAPPNNWDSMTYHLARVAHWAANRSVAFYPTPVLRQLHMPPLAEFAVLHLQVLSGGDRFANLVQWFSMAGSAVGVSLLARRLGAGPRGQVLAAVFCATLPVGILQASSTQNDAVTAFWLVCLAHALFEWRDRPGWGRALFAGTALGLALLTKGTAYLLAAPLVAVFLADFLRDPGRRSARAAAPLGLALAAALALNAPHYLRNHALYGSPLGPGGEGEAGDQLSYANSGHSLPILASNVVRNLASHLGTPYPNVNLALTDIIRAGHERLGLDPDDPRCTWMGVRFHVYPLRRDEDTTGNLVHLLLFAGTALLVGAWRRLARPLAALALGLAVLLGFGLFCGSLRWGPWHGRLHLPLFVLAAAVAGAVWERVPAWAQAGAVLVLLGGALPFLLANRTRPLLGPDSVLIARRAEVYFRKRPALLADYFGARDFLRARAPARAALLLGGDDWEYPFWVLLRGCRLEVVGVGNRSAGLGRPGRPEPPPALITTLDAPPVLTVEGGVYRRDWTSEHVKVYRLAGGRRDGR